jgi:serpin B
MTGHDSRLAHHLVLAACLTLVACGGTHDNGNALQPGTRLASDKARLLTPNPAPADLSDQVAGNTAFALDVYRHLAAHSQDGNLFYSPHSIEVALAMAWAGARGETERDMAQTLHFVLGQDRLHPVFNRLGLELASRGDGASGADGGAFKLNVVNSTWGQPGFTFLDGFLDVLALHYGAGIQLLDFAADPEKARGEINRWVEDQTEKRIQDLIPGGVLDTSTKLVLVSAIYFNAAWDEPFDQADTVEGPFRTLAGADATVPMMHMDHHLRYAAGDRYEAVELPYDGEDVSMLIIVPDAGRMSWFEQRLKPALLAEVVANLQSAEVVLTMPRWEVNGGTVRLRGILTDLGMGRAFTDGADFSGMTGGRDLEIADVLHQAYVKVDEAGTEAAAATAVPMMPTAAAPGARHVVTLDRPFIYVIRDEPTGQVLFMGRVADPS